LALLEDFTWGAVFSGLGKSSVPAAFIRTGGASATFFSHPATASGRVPFKAGANPILLFFPVL
jgi:hypothetical protein